MPWIIEREGASLRVQIACPVDDWEILFDEVERRLREEQGVLAIEMPESLPGASRTDADILVRAAPRPRAHLRHPYSPHRLGWASINAEGGS